MWPIMKITYREMISKRIFTITLLMSLAFLVLYGVATWYASKEITEELGDAADLLMETGFFSTQLLGMGLYFGSFITALLAILSSVGSIASEVESHQIDTWLARALPRRKYLLGKFFGLASMLVLYALLMFLGLLAINQFVGGGVLAVQVSLGQVLTALGFFILMPIILVCVSLLLSSITTTVTGGIILIILYGISFIGGFIEQLGSMIQQSSLINIGIVSSLLFPTDSLFRKSTIALFDTADDPISFASQGIFGSTSAPSDAMLIYTLLYGAAALWLAVRLFGKRDV
ncbi:ABC transporter permease subunit [Brevibacillus nitrificans]|uniref:ABC transporter permease n=1 Tax=Brevibacillus nitrificans TaxID=651560 RepID=UPI002865AEC3|nr:ABC transporter permease subunit [Brevibacillus nitrificans]MDR7314396.1 ABC-type transport system involved in multi-copper enzyme maturation permease subunit [Brevibacillus nitrificans]